MLHTNASVHCSLVCPRKPPSLIDTCAGSTKQANSYYHFLLNYVWILVGGANIANHLFVAPWPCIATHSLRTQVSMKKASFNHVIWISLNDLIVQFHVHNISKKMILCATKKLHTGKRLPFMQKKPQFKELRKMRFGTQTINITFFTNLLTMNQNHLSNRLWNMRARWMLQWVTPQKTSMGTRLPQSRS